MGIWGVNTVEINDFRFKKHGFRNFFSPSGEKVILVPLLFRITEFYSQDICHDKQAIHPQVYKRTTLFAKEYS